MENLEGKSVIITGASRGIGKATAVYLASKGLKVVLAARSQTEIAAVSQELNEQGYSSTYFECDVANYSQVKKLAEHTLDSFGSIDVLVNNAGLIDPIARLSDSDPMAWSNIVDVNLKGVYYCAHASLPNMLKNKAGTIINISSGAATSALEGWSHYCSTKAAVLSLTKCLHKEYGDRNIRTVGLSPGTVATEMQTQIRDSGINPVSQLDPNVHIPAEWVAKAIYFLCTSAGDDYLGSDFSLKTQEAKKMVGLPITPEQ